MTAALNGRLKHMKERLHEVWETHPAARKVHRLVRGVARRLGRTPRLRTESPNLLPVLIQVLAAFSKTAGTEALEDEIDSSLGFLRYDFPEAVYSDLRKLFRQALHEQQDLQVMAQKLAGEMTTERKVMLGVQLYDLICRAGLEQQQVVAFYEFMTQLGMASQAIDIVYQLNASGEDTDKTVFQQGQSPLESLSFGAGRAADVVLKGLKDDERLIAFRYHDLILLKNQSSRGIVVRGSPLRPGEFCRIYAGQRIVLGEQVLTYQDLAYYFNAKKNVSLTQIFLTIDSNDEVELEKVRTRDSAIEVRFGLKVQVRALKNVDALLNGIVLRAGTRMEATLDDRIIFHNDSELPLNDLRRRARALGGRFQLKAYKSGYLVSNNPSLLDVDDILLSPGTSGEVLLRILCDYDHKVGKLEVLQADRPILVGETSVPEKGTAALKDGDTISIDTGQVLRCNFSERILEEERNIISTLEVRDVMHYYRKTEPALDGINFLVNRGEMVCVMGASGCGKSTLLRAIAGQMQPQKGEILLNGQSLYPNLDDLKHFVSYIPQDDAFDEHLTIEENLEFAAAIRSPHLSTRDRTRRVEGKLVELGLSERRDSVVGRPERKRLSGGERKRLNIGLDMISSADVFLFDEPSSGLSSKDSEHVIEIIRSMAHNKIVLVTIHQPTSKLFQMFSKALLLDKGGRIVFYGTPKEMLEYFAAAEHEQHFGTSLGGCPACGTTRPEFIFDVLETPLRDLSGDIIYEENSQGQLVPARRFSPDFWRDKYESFRLLQEMKQVSVRKLAPAPSQPVSAPTPRGRTHFRLRDEWTRFRALWRRAFLSKLRNKLNLTLTLLIPPAIAILVALTLHYTAETGPYDFARAFHIPTYIFISLLLALFLGLVNSVTDIIRDRVTLHRERNLDVRLPYYIAAKFGTLCLFAAVQCAIFAFVGNAILEIRGMFWPYFYWLFLTSMAGSSLGLLVSGIVRDAMTAVLFVPLVLIPQLIFGGALIKYEEMNRNLDVRYVFQKFLTNNPIPELNDRENARLKIPLISRFVATHYTYEALIVAQAKQNPLASRQDALQDQIETLRVKKNRSEADDRRLEDLKDTLGLLSGLEAQSPREVEKRLRRVDAIIDGKTLDTSSLKSKPGDFHVDRLYTNQKVKDLVDNAEVEQSDIHKNVPVNVFFSPMKRYFRISATVGTWNTSILLVASGLLMAALFALLKRQLRPRGV
jgi:ABC-type multidrug transport system ATPase subunit